MVRFGTDTPQSPRSVTKILNRDLYHSFATGVFTMRCIGWTWRCAIGPEKMLPTIKGANGVSQDQQDGNREHDLVVVANRLPVDRKVLPDGSTSWVPSPGGLVAALEPVMQRNDGAWIGWTGAPGDAPEPFEARGI